MSSSEFGFEQIVYKEIKVELIPANAIPSKLSGDASYLLWPWFSFEVLLKLDVRGGGNFARIQEKFGPAISLTDLADQSLCSQGPDAAALSRAILATNTGIIWFTAVNEWDKEITCLLVTNLCHNFSRHSPSFTHITELYQIISSDLDRIPDTHSIGSWQWWIWMSGADPTLRPHSQRRLWTRIPSPPLSTSSIISFPSDKRWACGKLSISVDVKMINWIN